MLTIVSVSYKSKKYLDLNYKLVKALNPDTKFRWIVVQNTPEDVRGDDIALDDTRFEVIPGPLLTEYEKQSVGYGSFHHAKALNIASYYTDDDIILTLDPDCFVFMTDWLKKCIHHIQQEKIVFFGSPHDPHQPQFFRNFPNVICMFINRRLMQENNYFSMDFMPNIEHCRKHLGLHYHSHPKRILQFFSQKKRHSLLDWKDFPQVVKRCFVKLFRRFEVGRILDTGYKLQLLYSKILKHEELKVYAEDQRSYAVKLLESVLPDSFRLYPRNDEMVTSMQEEDFVEFGHLGSQFFWKGKFFAYHINGTSIPPDQRAKKVDEIFEVIEGKVNKVLSSQEVKNC